ncbi:MAG: DUF2007 domain-containing protein [Balneolaceae bacterium]|nr:DUF2007 domain-containing protein [Balneolaceae bacterium]
MDNSYILLKTYFHLHQAELDLKKLENEEINAYLADKNMGSFSFMGAATGGVKLYVAQKDFHHAKKILSDK